MAPHIRKNLFMAWILLFFISCTYGPSGEFWHTFRTHSKAFNELLAAAPIDVIDLDAIVPDTLWQTPLSPYCPVDSTGVSFGIIEDTAFLNDSTIVFLTRASSMGLLDLNNGSVRLVAHQGSGPGELRGPGRVEVWADTVFVVDRTFIHAFDLDMRFLWREVDRDRRHPYATVAFDEAHVIHRAMPNDSGASFYVRKRDGSAAAKPLFGPIWEYAGYPWMQPAFDLTFFSYNRFNRRLIFKYYSSPFLFLSDLDGDILRTVRLESEQTLSLEPDYSAANRNQSNEASHQTVMPQAGSSPWGELITRMRLHEDLTIDLLYSWKYFLRLHIKDGRFEVSRFYHFVSLDGAALAMTSAELYGEKVLGSSSHRECIYLFNIPH